MTDLHTDPPIPVPTVLVGDPGKSPSPALPYLFLFMRLREVARDHGYTLALHGSLNRDCDLIAVPWREGCSTVEALVQALAEAGELYRVPGRSDPTPRAHGRLAFALFPGGHEYIDLSVMPPLHGVAPVDQRPDGCYAACVAAITGLPLDQIPHPTPEELEREQWTSYHNRLILALRAEGWAMAWIAPHPPAGLSIMHGTSPRGLGHCVVGLGGALAWDPHPSRAGLVGPVEGYELLVRVICPPDDSAPA